MNMLLNSHGPHTHLSAQLPALAAGDLLRGRWLRLRRGSGRLNEYGVRNLCEVFLGSHC